MIFLITFILIFILSRVVVYFAKQRRDKINVFKPGGKAQIKDINRFINILDGHLWKMKK